MYERIIEQEKIMNSSANKAIRITIVDFITQDWLMLKTSNLVWRYR